MTLDEGNTAKTASWLLACMICTFMRENTSPYRQEAVACIRHSKMETRRLHDRRMQMGTPTMVEVKATVFVITLADKETSNQEHVRKTWHS